MTQDGWIRLSDIPSIPRDLPKPEAAPVEAFALPIDEFIAAKSEAPAALIGTDDDVLLPAHGLLLLAGRGGRGKTTLAVDAAFHLAAGREWLGFPVPRPLHVLIIENEGPRELFRRKLEAKQATWPHKTAGAIYVHTLDWGAFSLGELEQHNALRCFIDAAGIDLVIGDPLDSLGIEGVGSPEDTRRFLELLKRAGLLSTCAWWLLHHPRKERTSDELDEIAGAWGGRPDTALMLDLLEDDRARLGFLKVRWGSSGKRPAYILGFDRDTEGFTVLATEKELAERDLLTEIVGLLDGGKALTLKEIAAPKDKGGIGCDETTARALVKDHAEVFVMLTGDEAKARDRRASAQLWALAAEVRSPPERSERSERSTGAGAVGASGAFTPPPPEGGEVNAPQLHQGTQRSAFSPTAPASIDVEEVERLAGLAQQTLDAATGNGPATDLDDEFPF
jgi:hypothetical protein